jgi:CBS domain-containing protein
MKVRDVMTAQVVTAAPTDTIEKVARTMSQIDSGAVPIVDDGQVIGLVTDRDIVIRAVAQGRDLSGPISAVMTEGVQSCKEEDSVADAAGHMASQQVRRLVVYNDANKLAGIVSLGDIAVEYGAKAVGHTLEEISEGAEAHAQL